MSSFAADELRLCPPNVSDLSCPRCPATFVQYVSLHLYSIKKASKIKKLTRQILRVGVASGWAWAPFFAAACQQGAECNQLCFLCCFRLFSICAVADKEQPLNSNYGKTNIS